MIPRAALLVAFLAIPTLASAQRGGGGGGSRTRGDQRADWGSINGGATGLQLSNRDVEDMSPVKLLIDKRKDLKLTDDQLKGLKDVEQKLKTTNEPSFKALDSLRNEMKPKNSSPSDEDRERMGAARRTVPQVVATIRSNYATSLKDATSILNETQQQAAAEMLEKQSKESDQVLAEKLSGRKS